MSTPNHFHIVGHFVYFQFFIKENAEASPACFCFFFTHLQTTCFSLFLLCFSFFFFFSAWDTYNLFFPCCQAVGFSLSLSIYLFFNQLCLCAAYTTLFYNFRFSFFRLGMFYYRFGLCVSAVTFLKSVLGTHLVFFL